MPKKHDRRDTLPSRRARFGPFRNMTVGSLGLCWSLLAGGSTMALAAEPEVVYPQNVVSQFKGLSNVPEALGFDIADSPNPSTCRHYQGLARKSGPGIPYFFISRSNDDAPGPCGGDNKPGNLVVVRMDSRDMDGERVRSNRLRRDAWIVGSPPDALDRAITWVSFDGSPTSDGMASWPAYAHPGGMQLIGDVLAVALERHLYASDPENMIVFLDVSEPEDPKILKEVPLESMSGFSAGLVALAPAPEDGYVMLVTGQSNEVVLIYESLPLEWDEEASPTEKFRYLEWERVDIWTEDEDEADLGQGQDWPTGRGTSYQTINFVREGGPDGDLYAIAARSDCLLGSDLVCGDDNVLDLYLAEWEGDDFKLRFVHGKSINEVATVQDTNNPALADFAAAGGAYVSPSGELLYYATEHENDGPGNTVKMIEVRDLDIAWSVASPALNPTAVPDTVFETDEGFNVRLSASGRQPATKAWIALYEDDDYEQHRVHVIDYQDWDLEDNDDFSRLDPQVDSFSSPLTDGFSNVASSWRYFAPVGCSLRVNDYNFHEIDAAGSPGPRTRTLPGTGSVELEPDLADVSNDAGDEDMDDAISSMEFGADCDHYYSAPIDISWDLDADGNFETPGSTVLASTIGLDGPDSIEVQLRATHSVDGRQGEATATVIISNAPPQIGALTLFDVTGLRIGTQVPVVMAGSPVMLDANFTDPGSPDRQFTTILWGDGAEDAESEFDFYQDAFGGRTGQATHSHVYGLPGRYEIVLQVEDDDGGVDLRYETIDVVDTRGAILSVIASIDDLIAGSSDPELLAVLQAAREALAGNIGGQGSNGALDKLDSEDLAAAVLMIRAAIGALEIAEATGAGDLGDLRMLLALAAMSIGETAYTEALAAVDPPSPGEAKKLLRIRGALDAGSGALFNGNTAAAAEAYHEAVRMAVTLV